MVAAVRRPRAEILDGHHLRDDDSAARGQDVFQGLGR
jgi:hypothetical protein